jgi:ankyrin repeat protein
LEDKLVEKLSYIEIIKYLHNRFKETDEKKDEELSEKIAAWERSQSMTQELRELNYKYYPESAELFMLAVSRLNFEVVKAMISICPSISDIDDNATNFTALSSAIKSKSLEMTRILIAAGARINTTLNRHTNSRFPEITDFLKENLSVILYESITKNQIDTFFNIISFYREWHPRNLPWLKDLMDKTLDLAIRENNPLVITKLAKSKLDLNSPRLNLVDSKNGMTPLTKSISENNEEMFWALIEVGANTGKANGHDEAIDYVTRNTKPKIVVGLLKEIDILKINHGTKKILFQIPGIKELHDDAQRLNEILGQNSKLPKNLNQKEIREVIEIMERNQENIAVFDNIDEPKNRSILARCFLHIKSPAVIKEFIAHLPSFITKKNLTKPDYKQRIPLHLAMARAFDNEAFIPIASKLAAIMVIDNPELDITKYFPARKLTMTEKTYRSIAVKIITATSEDRERKQELPFDSFENDEIKEEKKMTIIHAKPDIKKAKSKALKSKGLVGLENKDK